MIKENVYLKGELEVIHYDVNKNIKSKEKYKNLIVNIGLETLAKMFNEIASGGFKYLAIGTSDTEENSTQTALISEITSPSGMARGLAECSYEADFKAVLEKIFTNNGESDITIREAGIFNASSDGQMFSRKVIPDKLLAPNESLLIIWKIIFQRG